MKLCGVIAGEPEQHRELPQSG